MKPRAPDADRSDAAYIARMCRELRDLASRSQFGFLAYLLDMSRLEAEAQLENTKAAPAPPGRRPAPSPDKDQPPDPPPRRRSFFGRGQI